MSNGYARRLVALSLDEALLLEQDGPALPHSPGSPCFGQGHWRTPCCCRALWATERALVRIQAMLVVVLAATPALSAGQRPPTVIGETVDKPPC